MGIIGQCRRAAGSDPEGCLASGTDGSLLRFGRLLSVANDCAKHTRKRFTRVLREAAFKERYKIHDMILQAIDAALRKRGYHPLTISRHAGGDRPSLVRVS